jgi:hypothetical protein
MAAKLEKAAMRSGPNAAKVMDSYQPSDLANAGLYQNAIDALGRIESPNHRGENAISVGLLAVQHGHAEVLPAVRAVVLPLIRDGNNEGRIRLETTLGLLHLCALAGDQDGVDETARELKSLKWANRGDDPRIEAGLAFAYAAVGNRELYEAHLRLSSNAPLAKAAAMARADEKDGVEQFVQTSLSIKDPALVDRHEDFLPIADGYILAGDLDAAMKFADDRHFDEYRQSLVCAQVAHALALKGNFAAARKAALHAAPRRQLAGLRSIAEQQVIQQKTDDLASWIDSLPDAQQRAVLDISVGEAVAKKPNRWFDVDTIDVPAL